jgi:hypothetical protein
MVIGLRLWAGRLAFIPIAVYALGTPAMLYIHKQFTLVADQYLPWELIGLALCFCLIIQAQIGQNK